MVTGSVNFAVPLNLKRILAAPVVAGLMDRVKLLVAIPLELAVSEKVEL